MLQDRRPRPPRPPAAQGCSRPRSVPRRWRGKSPRAAACPAGRTAAARMRVSRERRHRAISQVVPSLESFSTTPIAASSSRMRSDSGNSSPCALRCGPRSGFRSRPSKRGLRRAPGAAKPLSSAWLNRRTLSVPASALRPAAFFKPCISAIALGVLRSSSTPQARRGRTRIRFRRRCIEEGRECLFGFFESLHRPIDRLAVMARKHRERATSPGQSGKHLPDRHEIPETLAIFSPSTCRKPLCIQKFAITRMERAARLRDLVLVVREHQIDAAAVDVEVSPRCFHDIAEHSMCQPGRPGWRSPPATARPARQAWTASTARNPSGRACRARRRRARPRSSRRAGASTTARSPSSKAR